MSNLSPPKKLAKARTDIIDAHHAAIELGKKAEAVVTAVNHLEAMGPRQEDWAMTLQQTAKSLPRLTGRVAAELGVSKSDLK